MFPSNTRVLVVDDMMTMRAMVKNQVRSLGFTEILNAQNGQEALEIIKTQRKIGQPIQLVLSDWNMPVMTGIQLLRTLRESEDFKKIPFVLITAEGEEGQVKEAIELRVNQYIRKPFNPATVKEKLEIVWKQVAKDFESQ